MKPEVGTILKLSVERLAGGIGDSGAAFAQGTLGLIGMMMAMSATEYDRAADIRASENAELRALFGALAQKVSNAQLRTRLEDASRSRDASLRVSALNESNYALRRLLDELLIDVESQGSHESQMRIWSLVKKIAERRVVPLG